MSTAIMTDIASSNGATANGTAPPLSGSMRLIDPATLTEPVPPVFPLKVNGVHAFARYRDAAIPGVGAALEARAALPRGAHLCFITTATPAPARTWSSVQAGADAHVELNSALVYINHSCRPSVEFHMRGAAATSPTADTAADPAATAAETSKAGVGGALSSRGLANGVASSKRNNNSGGGSGGGGSAWPAGAVGEVRVARDRDLAAGDELTFFYPSTEWSASRPFTCLCGAGAGVCIGEHRGSQHLPRALLQRYFVNAHVLQLLAERDAADESEH
jgi:hypothetical protein